MQIELAPRMERALIVLAAHAQQLDGRLERLERRIDEVGDLATDGPTHDDVVQVRVHSARVAAELARVSVELRAEIEHAVQAARAAQATGARNRRIDTLAEQIIDLSDGFDTRPGDLGPGGPTTGWAATG